MVHLIIFIFILFRLFQGTGYRMIVVLQYVIACYLVGHSILCPVPGESPVGNPAVCMEVPMFLAASPVLYPRHPLIRSGAFYSVFSWDCYILCRFLWFFVFRILRLDCWSFRSTLSIPSVLRRISFFSLHWLFPFPLLLRLVSLPVVSFLPHSCNSLCFCRLFRIFRSWFPLVFFQRACSWGYLPVLASLLL